MLYLSGLEATFMAVWILGILVAAALILLKSPDLRTRILLLVFSIAVPVFGSVAVIIYGVFKLFRKRPANQRT
ncbi:hypothetical protein SAMN04489745_0435 [Arthrobacter woluwensis]|uniref:Uncharacterized protein n=2 Tax=Arthrobacter woluwensis TaxID=156980 RepID=A0A1H4JXC3_9MICC|nr:hypothetical protein SAMN04489745_0435 [Arthrobacter woluwensis]